MSLEDEYHKSVSDVDRAYFDKKISAKERHKRLKDLQKRYWEAVSREYHKESEDK
jgi:hypothetical protein